MRRLEIGIGGLLVGALAAAWFALSPEVATRVAAQQEAPARTETFDATVDRTVAQVEAAAQASQKAWAEHLKLPVVEKNGLGMELVLLPPGKFLMGSPDSDRDPDWDMGAYDWEKPRHQVALTKPLYMGKTEVTVGQFRRFVDDAKFRTDAEKDGKGGFGIDPSSVTWTRKPEFTWRNAGFPQEEDHPVVHVSRNDAREFCAWLSRREGKTYRLPTEAEWEYACRAGTRTMYHFGDDPEVLAQYGNVVDGTAKERFANWNWAIESKDGYVFTAPVGRFRSNGFGLHDMHGNVWEWCGDWYDEKYYANSPAQDPTGPANGSNRLRRGGSWLDGPGYVRSAHRSRHSPGDRYDNLGFRVAAVPSGEDR